MLFGNHMKAVEKATEKKNVASLIKLGDDSDMAVKLAAVKGLGSIGGQEAANFLVTRLHSPETEMRIAVANALCEIGDMQTGRE